MAGALTPITREAKRPDGEVVREFDLRSAAIVVGAFVGGGLLIFFLITFLPWLLSKGMTAAVEGLMTRIGFGDFHADTIWSWLLVLLMLAAFTVFLVAIITAILGLYNVLSQRTGMGLHVMKQQPEVEPAKPRAAIAEPVPEAGRGDDLDDLSFDELYSEAVARDIKGRSNMSKGELQAALRRRRRPSKSRSRSR